jgi:hypothetical protein
MPIDRDTREGEHLGFHFTDHSEEGIYYGREKRDAGGMPEVRCDTIAAKVKLTLYTLIRNNMGNRQEIPYCYFEMHGIEGHSPASEFSLRLKAEGIPLSSWMTMELTNTLVRKSRLNSAYEEPGYAIVPNQEETLRKKKSMISRIRGLGISDDEMPMYLPAENDLGIKKFKLISLQDTYRKFGSNLPDEKQLEDVLGDLRELYDATKDKKAFLIAFSYSIFSPFSSIVRQRRMFFPNLIFLGLPETGKNSLLNLFLAKMWSMDENIKVSGDFRADFATMANLEGSGPPITINDLDQQGYDRMRPFLLEGAMNPKGGSRGRPSLDLRKYETLRGIAISANYLRIGGVENTSRFIIHSLEENDGSNASEWNSVAARLEGAMYPVARYFMDFINSRLDAETFLGYFDDKRTSVKSSILEFGAQVLERLFSRNDPSFKLPSGLASYEEYEEDYFSLFFGWAQLALRKMQKETNYAERDYGSREVITIRYEDSLYIQESGSDLMIFPMAWREFLKKYPEFPFQSMEAFAHSYPQYVRCQPRKFRMEGQDDRKSFRVLMIKKMAQESTTEPEKPKEVSR